MNRLPCVLAFVSASLLASPARAEIQWIRGEVLTSDFRKTTIPFLQGKITQYELKGPWLDHAKYVDGLGSTIHLEKLETVLFDPKVILRLRVDADAAPGKRTLTLRKAPGFPTNSEKIDDLTIYIVPAGTFTSVEDPVLPSYFTTARVTLSGTKLRNAAVETSGWPSGTTASIDTSQTTDTKLVVVLNFRERMVEASGDIQVHDKDMPSLCANLPATYYYKASGSTSSRKRVKVTGPNSVKTIFFPSGSSYDWGGTITMRLIFYRPIRPQGDVIYWNLQPSTRSDGHQVAQAVSPTTYSTAAQFNSRTANAGTASVDLTVKICSCPTNGSVTLRTWFGATNIVPPGPSYLDKSFTVSCPTGFNANPKC